MHIFIELVHLLYENCLWYLSIFIIRLKFQCVLSFKGVIIHFYQTIIIALSFLYSRMALGCFLSLSLIIYYFSHCLSSLSPLPSFQSETLHINPLQTLIPSTMCVSFGVMLPVGNPPNAIVFSYGHVQISDMVRQMHTRARQVTCAFCICSIKRLKNATGQSCLM